MESIEVHACWLTFGAQKRAIAKALCKPMLISEIHHHAKKEAPKLRLKHVRPVLQKLMTHGMVKCLTPNHESGAIYALTPTGSKVAEQAFGIEVLQIPENTDWELYRRIVRGKTRSTILQEVGTLHLDGTTGKTATQIRKNLRDTYPLGLNPVIDTLKFLWKSGLIQVAGRTQKRDLKLYSTTAKGEEFLNLMK